MAGLFASGRVVDLILVLLAAEAVALAAYHGRTGRGPGLRGIVPTLVAGACLLLALRSALVQGAWYWTATFLWAALIAHAVDLANRWRGRV